MANFGTKIGPILRVLGNNVKGVYYYKCESMQYTIIDALAANSNIQTAVNPDDMMVC